MLMMMKVLMLMHLCPQCQRNMRKSEWKQAVVLKKASVQLLLHLEQIGV